MKYRSLKSEVLQFLLTKGDRKGQGIFQFIYYVTMRDLSPYRLCAWNFICLEMRIL